MTFCKTPWAARCRGIYGPLRNQGTVSLGNSADTPQFAVDVLARWWQTWACLRYPRAEQLLILADGGGSKASRSRVWKHQLPAQLCDRFGLTVAVCHYPAACSKWNPVEHRVFGPISLTWAGKPLFSWDARLAYLRGTQTTTGLAVPAFLQEATYTTGGTVSDADLETLNLQRHASWFAHFGSGSQEMAFDGNTSLLTAHCDRCECSVMIVHSVHSRACALQKRENRTTGCRLADQAPQGVTQYHRLLHDLRPSAAQQRKCLVTLHNRILESPEKSANREK
jgi:hypothetical protein